MTAEFDPAQVSERWAEWRRLVDLEEYDQRWSRLAADGRATHGEGDLVMRYHPAAVLDAGCGMGRVAIELARRGVDVVGVDLDPDLLAYARSHAPDLDWRVADLATLQLGRRFDVVVMAGNVMVFCRPDARRPIIESMARHLLPGARLVAGFSIDGSASPGGAEVLSLEEYDTAAAGAGLVLEDRWSTWEGDPYEGGTYAVSVHRLAG